MSRTKKNGKLGFDMKNDASELFRQVPRAFNCAQAVAAGCGRPELAAELAACGGGRAPGGRCGALHAALLLSPPEARERIRAAFAKQLGSELCRELKSVHHVPCERCVELAAELAEEPR